MGSIPFRNLMLNKSNFIRLVFFFSIFLSSAVANAQCCWYRLTMQDSYGDGWNGGYLEIKINGSSIGTFAAIQYGSVDSFQVCQGDAITIYYTSGSYENENTYQLHDAAWNLIHQDGPTPATGLVFSSTGNCLSTPVLGSHPCVALPIDTGMCVVQNNSGFPGSGLVPNCASYQGSDIWFKIGRAHV